MGKSRTHSMCPIKATTWTMKETTAQLRQLDASVWEVCRITDCDSMLSELEKGRYIQCAGLMPQYMNFNTHN